MSFMIVRSKSANEVKQKHKTYVYSYGFLRNNELILLGLILLGPNSALIGQTGQTDLAWSKTDLA